MEKTVNSHAQQKKGLQLSHQLALTENILEKHPLTHDKLIIVQMALNHLSQQAKWLSAGPLIRFLITLETGLYASQTSKSATGFIGPSLERFEQAAAALMMTWVDKDLEGAKSFFQSYVQVALTISTYLLTQILGDWKALFIQNDQAASKKGGELLQELGILFLIGSQTIREAFYLMAKGLEVDEKGQKMIGDLGVLCILISLMVLLDGIHSSQAEWEEVYKFMLSPIHSLEETLERAHSQRIIDEETLLMALSHLQLIRRALEDQDIQALPQLLESGFQIFNLSYHKLQDDLKQLTQFCRQLNKSFKNIFYQFDQAVTTVDQAA